MLSWPLSVTGDGPEVIAFLEASALIYLMDGEPAWAAVVKRELQSMAVGQLNLPIALSRLSVLECRVGPLKRGDQASLNRFETFFGQPDLQWVELTASVVERATTLRATHGLRTPDALQAACCLQLGSEAVMVSGDADFCRLDGLQLRLIR
jgi:predicted nucleic acid-binding protein